MPYTGIVLAILAVHLAAFLILIAHWLVSAGLFPRAAEKFADVYDRRPIRAVLIGVITYLPIQFLALNAGKINNGPIKFVVVIAGFASLLVGLIGTGGLALRIGRNLSAGTDTWRQVLRGGVMLALVFITPLLGWFFALPVGLASGFGAFLLARPWKASVPASVALPLPEALQVAPPLPVATTEAPVATTAPTLS
jgi:hypothetical protein